MEKHALNVVNRGPIDPGSLPEPPGQTTEERSNHDPPELPLPSPKSRRMLIPLDKQLSVALHSASTVETDHVRSETVACDASELEETPAVNFSTTGKSQVVAEMMEHAFATFEKGNCKPETRTMDLLQVLSKHYEGEKAVAMEEFARLEEQSKLDAENLQITLSELERVTSQNEELKNRTSRDLGQNLNLRSIVEATVKAMEDLRNGNESEKLQNELLSSRKTVEVLTKAILEKPTRLKNGQVKLLESKIKERDTKIELQSKEILELKETIGGTQGMQDSGVPTKAPAPSAEGQMQSQELQHTGPILKVAVKWPMRRADINRFQALPVHMLPDAPECVKLIYSPISRLSPAMLALGKALDQQSKEIFQAKRTEEWTYYISKITPDDPHFFSNPHFLSNPHLDKYLWSHWICAIMFADFESESFGMNDVPSCNSCPCPLKELQGCSTFGAFVSRKYRAAFPAWLSKVLVQGSTNETVNYLFKVVAKIAWKIHQIEQRCDPPARLLRPVPFETKCDPRYHLLLQEQPPARRGAIVVLTLSPGFQLGTSVFKSVVYYRTQDVVTVNN